MAERQNKVRLMVDATLSNTFEAVSMTEWLPEGLRRAAENAFDRVNNVTREVFDERFVVIRVDGQVVGVEHPVGEGLNDQWPKEVRDLYYAAVEKASGE